MQKQIYEKGICNYCGKLGELDSCHICGFAKTQQYFNYNPEIDNLNIKIDKLFEEIRSLKNILLNIKYKQAKIRKEDIKKLMQDNP